MTYRELALKINEGYKELKKDTLYKEYYVLWEDGLRTREITVENDGGFKAIIIGKKNQGSRGFMNLFYSNNGTWPTEMEIARRLEAVANLKPLTDKNACYHDWEEYGSLEQQRKYFSEIILNALTQY